MILWYNCPMAKKSTPSLFIFSLLVVFCLLLIFLNISIWQERAEKKRHLGSIREELEQNFEEEIITYDLDDEFTVERIAREQLLMAREGEEVVVILRNEEEEEEDKEEEEDPGFFEQLMDILR